MSSSSCSRSLSRGDSSQDDMKPYSTDVQSGTSDILNEKNEFGTLNEIATLVRTYLDSLCIEGIGRICIVGGGQSPITDIFGAIEAALQSRAEVITVLCTPKVANSVKLYNSFLKVLPYLPEVDDSKANDFVTKVWPLVKDNEALCFATDLWADEVRENAVEKLILRARLGDIPIVLYSCALWLLKKRSSLLSQDLPFAPVLVVLNEQEFVEIWYSLHSGGIMSFRESSKDPQPHPAGDLTKYPYTEVFSLKSYPDAISLHQTAHVSDALGPNVVVLRVGLMDIISQCRRCFLFGGPKFSNVCKGQKCLLAGLATLFLSWLKLQGRMTKPIIAACGADFVVRLATIDAYSALKDGDEFRAAHVAKVIPAVMRNIIDGVPSK